jgi:hypothetical protein
LRCDSQTLRGSVHFWLTVSGWYPRGVPRPDIFLMIRLRLNAPAWIRYLRLRTLSAIVFSFNALLATMAGSHMARRDVTEIEFVPLRMSGLSPNVRGGPRALRLCRGEQLSWMRLTPAGIVTGLSSIGVIASTAPGNHGFGWAQRRMRHRLHRAGMQKATGDWPQRQCPPEARVHFAGNRSD